MDETNQQYIAEIVNNLVLAVQDSVEAVVTGIYLEPSASGETPIRIATRDENYPLVFTARLEPAS